MTRERRYDGGEINKQAKRKGNMRISILTIGAVASIIAINSVSADTTSTVTSRGYVDAEVAKKQNIIPEAYMNYEENGTGETVVTYTNNAGVLGEREIMNSIYDYDYTMPKHSDWLVSAGALDEAIKRNKYGVYNVAQKICTEWVAGQAQTDANCLLWDLVPVNINYEKCYSNHDCAINACCRNNVCGDCPT